MISNLRDKPAKVCIVSSGGGHLTEVRALHPAYGAYEHFFVLNIIIPLPEELHGRTQFIRHSERDWKFFVNLWEALRILVRERPGVILSTGAGPAVPFAIVGKLLGIPTVFVETVARVSSPSLTGRLMYRLADSFYYQWEPLRRYFPRGLYAGGLL